MAVEHRVRALALGFCSQFFSFGSAMDDAIGRSLISFFGAIAALSGKSQIDDFAHGPGRYFLRKASSDTTSALFVSPSGASDFVSFASLAFGLAFAPDDLASAFAVGMASGAS